jgi:site-specific DNA recombinase
MNPLPTRLTAKSLKPENIMVSYVRVSTQEQRLNGSSYEAQEKQLRDYAKLKGKTVRVYGDICSGAIKPEDRPGLSAALKFIFDGNADAIAVTRIDRLSRSMRDFIILIGRFAERKPPVVFHSLELSLDTSTPMGVFTIQLFGALGQMERSVIKERTTSTLTFMREENRVIGNIPYGKKADDRDGLRFLVDNPEELSIIQRVRELRAQQVTNKRGKIAPMTYQAICEVLISEGVKNREGSTKWYPSSIKHLFPKKLKTAK